MTLKYLQNKKIAMLGLGIENYALIKFLLKKKIKVKITVCDQRSEKELGDKFLELNKFKNISWRLGDGFNKNLFEFDILFRSPGWPIESINNEKLIINNYLYSAIRLFSDLCPTKNIIGVTGTKGKGTTSSLIYEILKKGNKRVWLGGNIGVAPFEFINKIKKNDWVVLELSSFQLEDFNKSPYIAVVTNFYKEHLAPADPNNPNYHKTAGDYWDAKANIFKFQKKGDYLIINHQIKIHHQTSQTPNPPPPAPPEYRRAVIYFTKLELPSKLVGEHNQENIAAAVEVAKIVGIKPEVVARAVKNFKGLEHRIEFAGEVDGAKYYNDSFATVPEATITALKSFSAPIILLVGGADKGSDFKTLAKEIKKRVKFVVLLDGQATPRIKKELLKINYQEEKMKLVFNITDAVKAARSQTKTGDIVLLSPACASFGMFKNYKERGKLFKEYCHS
jgi:UDP-N-acetylmuramoylalanine--D-glutamate ligase